MHWRFAKVQFYRSNSRISNSTKNTFLLNFVRKEWGCLFFFVLISLSWRCKTAYELLIPDFVTSNNNCRIIQSRCTKNSLNTPVLQVLTYLKCSHLYTGNLQQVYSDTIDKQKLGCMFRESDCTFETGWMTFLFICSRMSACAK